MTVLNTVEKQNREYRTTQGQLCESHLFQSRT